MLALTELADGNFLFVGQFMDVPGFSRSGLARLHANGSFDLGFDARLCGYLRTIVVQPVGFAFLMRVEGTLRSGMFNASTVIAQTMKRLQRPDRLFRDGFE